MESIPGRRRRGRPSLVAGEQSVSVTMSIPQSVYDGLVYQALRAHIGLAGVARHFLIQGIAHQFSTDKLKRPKE